MRLIEHLSTEGLGRLDRHVLVAFGRLRWNYMRPARGVEACTWPGARCRVDHALFHTMFDLKEIPQIPGIGNWFAGRNTSERGADSANVHARAITDPHGRIMVFMTHNTDVSDSWEREGEDPQYFYQFSIDGYRVAVNVMLYAMTH
jgi:hypothetical protein